MEESFYSKTPNSLLLEITTKCNLSCVYCKPRSHILFPKDMPLDFLEKIKPEIVRFEKIVLCGMGEIFVHRNIYEFVHSLKEVKDISTVTNGTIKVDFEKLNKYDNISTFVISLDSPIESVNKEICETYNQKNLVENIKKSVLHQIPVCLNTTINRLNYQHLDLLADFAAEHKISKINFIFPLGDEQWLNDNIDEISQNVQSAVKKLIEYNIDYELPNTLKCSVDGAPIPYVSVNGKVRFCCIYESAVPFVGNFLKESFSGIWEKQMYKKFQEGHYCKGCLRYKHAKKYDFLESVI